MESRKFSLVLQSSKIVTVALIIITIALSGQSEDCSDTANMTFTKINTNGDRLSGLSPTTQCDDNDPRDTRHKLYLVAMGPFPESDNTSSLHPNWGGGPSLVAAVELAVRHINKNSSVLPDYRLCVIEADSGCDIKSKLTISIIKDIYNREKQVVGIIGPACSDAALLLAPLNARPNVSIINITPSAISPLLSNDSFNHTFATIATSLHYVDEFLALIKRNKWTSIATLHDEEGVFFRSTFSVFRELAEKHLQIRNWFSSALYDNEKNPEIRSFPLDQLKESQYRVVFAFVDSKTAPKLLCLASKKEMLYPSYQWIFHERTMSHIITNVSFELDGTKYNCCKEEMKCAAHGVILNNYNLKQTKEIDVIGKTYEEFWNEYKNSFNEYLSRIGKNQSDRDAYATTHFANPYYDATWAMALALHNASENGVNLSTYTHNQPENTEVIRQALFNVNFSGASGPIFFNNDTRATETVIIMTQLWENEPGHLQENNIGIFSKNKLTIENAQFIDSDTFKTDVERLNIGASVIIITITVVLLVLTALLQAAFLFWQHHRCIKATSPNISHLIYSGCYLFSISVITFAIQETFTYATSVYPVLYAVFCNLIIWCMILGFSLIFGTVLAREWRVYRLFKHFRNESPGILLTDNALIVFVIILLVVDTCLLVTWNLVDPLIQEQHEVDITTMNDIPTIVLRSQCKCKNLTIWVGVVGVYKGFITIGLVLFSILNQKIRRKDFRHSKKVNILIYSLTIAIVLGIPLYFLLRGFNIHIGFIILCFILNLTVTMCCLMLFIPPVIPVLKMKMGIDREETFRRALSRKISIVSAISFF